MFAKKKRWSLPQYSFLGVALGTVAWTYINKRRNNRLTVATTKSYGAEAAVARHERKVNQIVQQLRQRPNKAPLSLRKESVSHEVPKAVDKKYTDEKIDVRALNEIIEIDVLNKTCVAEAGVTFVDLVTATLRHGLVPIIVPELKTVTIGGAVAGCSLESMSFRYGGFHDTCLEYELITARGKVLVCTPTGENELIFQMLHGSFGTLGIISKLKFRLISAKPFVKLDYLKFSSLEAYRDAVATYTLRRDVDFIDGIIHSPAEWVLSIGRFVDEAPYTNRYDWMKIYYQSTAQRETDYLRTADYFFRYDRGVTNVRPSSLLGRFFLGKFIGSSQILRAAEKLHWLLPVDRPAVTLDVFLPFSKFEQFMHWYRSEFGFFPLWCVPYWLARPYAWIAPEFAAKMPDQLFMDIGIYGMAQRDERNLYKMMEEKLFELGGVKTLIAHNYYTEDEFWQVWNKDNYFKVKAVTDPDNLFRDLYTKTCKRSERSTQPSQPPRERTHPQASI